MGMKLFALVRAVVSAMSSLLLPLASIPGEGEHADRLKISNFMQFLPADGCSKFIESLRSDAARRPAWQWEEKLATLEAQHVDL